MTSLTSSPARAVLRWDLAARVPVALLVPALTGAATGHHGATGRVSVVAGLAGASASAAALVTVGALGRFASPVTMVLLALAGAGWALVLSAFTGRYLPTPRLTLPATVTTITGHPAALLDMARRWTNWRFPLLLGAATGEVYLLAVGLLEVKPYWVVFALAATLRPGVAAVRTSARDTVAGTLAGAVIATSLVHLLPGTWPLVLALLVLTTAGLLASLAEPRLVRVLVTPVVVIAAGLAAGDGSLSPNAFAALRVLDFAAGAAIALALAWLVGRPWLRRPPGGPGAETGGPT